MKKLIAPLFVAAALLCSTSYAVPYLQLDASNSTYVDGASQTVVANSPQFTLFALVDSLTPSGTFYISAALTSTSQSGNYGSFVFNGNTVNVTSDMTFGTPHNLPTHDIFPAWYKEFAFTFSTVDNSNKFTNYDASYLGVHNGPTQSNTGNARFAAFSVDFSGLTDDTTIHFDLYNLTTNNKGEVVIKKFAPFSHDAEGGNYVPEGGVSVMLLGLGLIALALFRRNIA